VGIRTEVWDASDWTVVQRCLADLDPQVDPQRLVAELAPPPRFAEVSFASYRPDPAQPSQAAAVQLLEQFSASIGAGRGGQGRKRLFGGRRRETPPAEPAGLYLDGGFGVGKTHLLASLWHTAPAPKAYGTFVAITSLVGALGFAGTVEALAGCSLLCIDEFELDDPGDTVLVSTLLSRLVERGVRLAATSNTQPDDLGEGRFAAADFLREIQGLSAHFRPLRIDGEDFRHRGLPAAPPPRTDEQVRAYAAGNPGATLDSWPQLTGHLARLHPSRYGALAEQVAAVCVLGIEPLADQNTALRLVAFVDRLYDRDVPVVASGVPLDAVFPPEFLAGGYRKKYQRAISRLTALARVAGQPQDAAAEIGQG
jgi:cell division protein ZapE